MLAGTLTPKPEAKKAEANAIVPIGRSCADMVLASPIIPATMFMRNSITKRCKLGNPALVCAHFADAISPGKSNCLTCLRRRKLVGSVRIVGYLATK